MVRVVRVVLEQHLEQPAVVHAEVDVRDGGRQHLEVHELVADVHVNDARVKCRHEALRVLLHLLFDWLSVCVDALIRWVRRCLLKTHCLSADSRDRPWQSERDGPIVPTMQKHNSHSRKQCIEDPNVFDVENYNE